MFQIRLDMRSNNDETFTGPAEEPEALISQDASLEQRFFLQVFTFTGD